MSEEEEHSEKDDAAMDGMIREYARTGGSGDDEPFVKSVLRSVRQKKREDAKGESDLPWLFGGAFWKVAAAIAFLFAAGVAGRTWVVESRVADPTEVFVFAQPRVAAGAASSVRVLVRDGHTLQPIANATVNIALAGNQIAKAQTGDDGIADITAEFDAKLAEGDYTLEVDVQASTGKASAELPVKIARAFRTMLSTDKPLYQPGQTIHIRALSLETDTLEPADGRPVAFEVRDGKGNKVFGKEVETSDFGIAAADFKLADQVNEGAYTIAVSVGDVVSEREVKVERYVLPKFKVALSADRTWYRPGDTVKASLDANYTFGKPVAGGKVELRADEFIERFRTFNQINGETDENGQFEFELELKDAFVGQQLNKGDAFVRLVAEVTDATGETRPQTIQLKVTNRPIAIEVFPESGELVQKVENTVYILTAYPDGRPAETTVKTEGGTEIKTNELGIAKVKLTPNRKNLKLTLTARDAAGAVGHVVKELPVGERVDGILLRTDRAVYRQGETANLTVLSASRAKRVFLDVVKNGRSFATASIPLDKRAGSYALDLPSDIAGTVQVQAYAILEGGEIIRDTKVIQIHRADQLKIAATLDAETYRPAEKAMIEFLVTNKDGDPVEAALSLAAVDEAVFALSDSRPGLEEMYFLIQEEILKPRYQFDISPRSDLASVPDPSTATGSALVEANVVAFSAAGDAAPPEKASGEPFQKRESTIRIAGEKNERFLASLIAWVPFAFFMLFTLSFIVYGLSRIAFKPSGREGAAPVEDVRQGLNLLFWSAVGIMLFIPLIIMILVNQMRHLEEEVAVMIIVLLLVAGTVILAAIARRIRKLPHVQQRLRSLRKVIGFVPAAFFLGGCVFVGAIIADEVDRQALTGVTESAIFGISIIGFILVLVILGALRRTLTETRSVGENLSSLAAHFAGFVLLPAILASFATPVYNKVASRADTANAIGFLGLTEEMAEAGSAFPMDPIAPSGNGATEPEPTTPRIRRHFPETLLWTPQLLTDQAGKATLEVDLADSITTWRLSGSAVSKRGELGSVLEGIRVFQDFFIDIDFPAELTQNDEITIPIAIFNYLEKPQSIDLEVREGDWFEFVEDSAAKTVETAAGSASASSFRIRVLKPGLHSMTVLAKGTQLSDAVERRVRVIPDGQRIEHVVNGRLSDRSADTISIPANAIEGGNDLFVKIYPGAFSQVVEGMDSIFRMPYGCFEQASSTTYPNILVLDYLRTTKQVKPDLEMKALEFINAGYQRLLSYEVDGGGFEWFGHSPAHPILSAYGLMEFVDMAKVYEIDEAVIERTVDYLMRLRNNDGSWKPVTGGIAEGAINSFQGGEKAVVLRSTAYIAWAIAEAGGANIDSTFDFLASNADGVNDPYALALIANAFVSADRCDEASEILTQLVGLKETPGEGLVAWKSEGSGVTHGRGESFSIETTALVAQAMMRANKHVVTAHKALAWLISKRDGGGTWYSTQATVQAMRALLLGAGSVGEVEGEVEVAISVNGVATNPLQITEENADVFHLVSLTNLVRDGDNEVALEIDDEANLSYQIVSVYYMPEAPAKEPREEILQIDTNYATTRLATDDLLTVTVKLRYNRPNDAPMTLVDLGIPPGFEIDADSFQKLLDDQVITRFEPKGRQVSLYFNSIPGDGKTTLFRYSLRAKFPVKAKAPASVAYQYYEPEIRDETEPVLLIVE